MTRRTDVAWRYPRCAAVVHEPPRAKQAWHRCQPPGRPAKTVELQRIDNDAA